MKEDNSKNNNNKTGAVLVVGGGIAGIQASLDLANSGFKIYLTEDVPAIGGIMAQLDKTFPTNDCAMCIMSPKLVECGRHFNIDFLPQTEIEEINGEPGNFTVKLYKRPAYIDLEKCTGCGECEKVCPVELPSEFDEGIVNKKAVFRLFAQAYPNAFVIEKKARPPCQRSCPAGIHVQGYVALIAKGKYQEAYNLIKEKNPFPAVCGRVCHHPCEDDCRRGEYDQPIAIASLKRFVSDYVAAHKDELQSDDHEKVITKEEKVAVIGSGPGGLSCAYYLSKMGYPVTVFEADSTPGGMMRTGIPPYRLPRTELDWEINEILKSGIELKTNTPINSKHDFEDLKKDGYKAFFLAVGVQKGRKLKIEGSELTNVLIGLEFLKSANVSSQPKIGKRVVVIGGGNVAIDVARYAVRYGADEVNLTCLESRNEMPAHEWEIESAVEEGIKLHPSLGPKKFVGRNDSVCGIELIKCVSVLDEQGKFSPKFDENVRTSIECDTIIIAIGQAPDFEFLEHTGVKITPYGTILVDPVTLGTTENGFFAGGDAVSGPASVVEAVAHGYEAAISIDRFLRAQEIKKGREGKLQDRELPMKEFSEFIEIAKRETMPVLPANQRIRNFKEIDLGFTEEMAQREANRCLDCGLCSECLECERACEADAILHSMLGENKNINVGAVILALGGKKFDPSLKYEFGYGKFSNVITSIQFERILAASGPFQGHVQRPGDGKMPKKIAWIQCVGSRDEQARNKYCSSVCCMYAIKEAMIAKEHVKSIEPTIFFMDIRAFGKDFDKYYERAKQEYGVRFVRSRVGNVKELSESGNLLVYFTGEDGKQLYEEFDLVVLSVGFEPSRSVIAVSDKLGIRLNKFNFFKTLNFAPTQTTRPGIFVCGVAASPKDIPETVMQASSAASGAAELLADVRGSEVVEKTYPPERDVSSEPPKIGVFVCQCGINIGGIVDVPGVVEYAKTLSGVVYAEDNLFTCSQDTQGKIISAIEEHNLNRVVVASCSPRTHEPLFQETLREAGLNPQLFEMANIRDQCSWVHMNEPDKATKKAKILVRMAVAKARLLESLPRLTLPVIQKGLVIGGGLAGMVSALAIAEQGFEVYLVEREKELGGNLRNIYYSIEGNDTQQYLHSLIDKVENHPHIKIFKSSVIEKIDGYIGNYKTVVTSHQSPVTSHKINQKSNIKNQNDPEGKSEISYGAGISKFKNEEEGKNSNIEIQNNEVEDTEDRAVTSHEIEHGIIVVATGAEESRPKEYLYGEDQRVITQLELEKLLSQDRRQKAEGRRQKTSDIRHLSSAVMIQCVGSRDDEHPYCSRVCCQEAIKNALKLKEINPQITIYILYRDIRTYGFYEEYYQKARDAGIIFIRYEKEEKPTVEKKSEIRNPKSEIKKRDKEKLTVRIRDQILDRELVIDSDLVVLAPAIVPYTDTIDLAQMLKVPLNQDNFFLEAHIKLRPVDFATEGIFLAGLAHSPKTIDESISQAKAASSKALIILSKDTYEAEAIISTVNTDICAGCGVCETVCPYSAPEIVLKDGRKVSQINKALCKGCGNCACACPSSAIDQLGFKSKQTLETLNAALEL